MQKLVYKVCQREAWSRAESSGFYDGSDDDLRDGYIHLSTVDQIRGTLLKFFSGQRGLVLLGFRPEDLGNALRWEPSRGGDLFPHLYARLPVGTLAVRHDLPLDAAGRHILPGDLV
jgi:uncharacterized protein (DUF952 family)